MTAGTSDPLHTAANNQTAGTHADAPLDALDHIAVSVRDIARAVAWYRDHFRCDIVYQDETWAMLQFQNVKLALVVPEQHPPHLGFVSPDAARFGKLKQHRDGTRSIYVGDADGNVVEILEPYPGAGA